MHERFQKDKPLFIRFQYVLLLRKRSQTEQTQESKRDNKQTIEKQHADNQSEEDSSHIGGKGEKEKETERNLKLV